LNADKRYDSSRRYDYKYPPNSIVPKYMKQTLKRELHSSIIIEKSSLAFNNG
jgi:hypothetical protein